MSQYGARPGYQGRAASHDEGFSRGVVIAMWIGGGSVVLMLLAMIVTSFLGGSDEPGPGAAGTDTTQDGAVAPADDSDAEEGPAAEDGGSGQSPASSTEDAHDGEAKPDDAPAARKDRSRPKQNKEGSRESKPQRRDEDEHDETAHRDGRPTRSSGGSSSPAAQSAVRLSAGVALAQSLPTGTAMMFSVDYQVVEQVGSAGTIWVIRTGDGQTVGRATPLEPRGTLQAVLPQLRPEHGPFDTCIQDGYGRQLSEWHTLR
jgi:hypothetical protein